MGAAGSSGCMEEFDAVFDMWGVPTGREGYSGGESSGAGDILAGKRGEEKEAVVLKLVERAFSGAAGVLKTRLCTGGKSRLAAFVGGVKETTRGLDNGACIGNRFAGFGLSSGVVVAQCRLWSVGLREC